MANRYGAILAADFGSVHTRLILLDLVDGAYRMVGRAEVRTTDNFPFNDVRVGLMRAAAQIAQATGRRLTTEEGVVITPEQPDHSGVDHFVATASTGRPLRAVLMGLVPEMSVASARRATAGTYIEVVETISLEDTRSEEDLLNALILSQPDLVFIAGGTEGGAREPLLALVRVVEQAVALMERPRRPQVLYAGNSALTPAIRAAFDGQTALIIAPNVRPSLDREDLDGVRQRLGQAFDRYIASRGSGFTSVGRASARGVLPTAYSHDTLVQYLSRVVESPALIVDVGSAVSTLSAYDDGSVRTIIRTDLGLGHSARQLLATLGDEAIARWIPFPVEPAELANYTLNKSVRPATIPETLRDLYIEQALLCAALTALMQTVRPVGALAEALPRYNPIIGCGAALTQTGSPGIAALLLLNAIQPEGITTLRTDPYGLVPALGALARVQPEAVVQTLDGGGLERLGMAVSLSGQPRAERPALDVRITTSTGEVIEQQVMGGHLWVYPLPTGQQAEVDIRVRARGASIGGRSRVRLTLDGGTAGLIFDARGRPLPLGNSPAQRAEQMPQWLADVTGSPMREIDPRWLKPQRAEKPARGAAETPAAEPKPQPSAAPQPAKARSGSRLRRPKADKDQQPASSEMEDLRDVLS